MKRLALTCLTVASMPFASAAAAQPDTIVEIETILYLANPGARVLTRVLHGREEEDVIRSITPTVAGRLGEATLVSAEFCLNGTGGLIFSRSRQGHFYWCSSRDISIGA